MGSKRGDNGDDAEKAAIRMARAARMRAARAFADLDQAEFAKLLGVSVVTIKRMERGTREISLDDLYALADRCAVPRDFMEAGFIYDEARAVGQHELRALTEAFSEALDARFDALTDALLSREEAMSVSRAALERLRSRPRIG